MLTKLSQTQAARAAGVSRASIWRAVRQGRLSVEQDQDGVRIDASELLRVFPRADLERAHEHVPNGAPSAREHPSAHEHALALRTLERLVDELTADKLHLRAELERAAQERARLLSMLDQQAEHVRLLTDARAKKQPWWRRRW